MRRLQTRGIALFSLALLVGSCQRSDDFLHHIVPQVPEVFHFTHKLKDIQGESRVDLLWSIDNSGSMDNHQKNVIKNTGDFMKLFTQNSALDWKMGLVSTDERDNPYVGFDPGDILDKNTPNPEQKFAAAVARLGTSGSGTEKPYFGIRKALMNYPGWSRKGAILAMLMITDAPEQSQISSADLVAFLVSLKGSTKNIVYYGVLNPTPPCVATDDTWSWPGSIYEDLTKLVASKTFWLCEPNFGAKLADMGKDLVKRVQSPRINLSKRPQVNTIRVTWKGKELPAGPKESGGVWRYDFDLNAVLFYNLDFAPDDREDVIVHFEEAFTSN